jgi:uncharacterized phage-associated protein
MIPYKKERLENAICFFIQQHEKKVRKPAYKTFIYKYLALFDFAVLEETGRPAFEIKYDAMERGPVPRGLYNNVDSIQFDKVEVFEDGDDRHVFSTKEEPDLDYFSDNEIALLHKIVNEAMRFRMKTNRVVEMSHQNIKAWKVAWDKRGTGKKEPMSYDDTFPCVHEKKERDLTAQEDAFLLYKASIQL